MWGRKKKEKYTDLSTQPMPIKTQEEYDKQVPVIIEPVNPEQQPQQIQPTQPQPLPQIAPATPNKEVKLLNLLIEIENYADNLKSYISYKLKEIE